MRFTTDQRRVVVGVDGSPNSLAALARAAREADRRHARLDVYQAVADTGNPIRHAGAWLKLRRLVSDRLPITQHVTTRLHIGFGDPSAVLIDAARGAELLVIGARIHSEQGSPLGGPVVPRVLSGASCEVV